MRTSLDTSGKKDECGFSVLEAMFACLVLMIGISGLMSLFVIAAARNAGQGDQATRTTEYAQDKMEQLMALSYNDSSSNVVGQITTSSGGAGLASGGSVYPNTPVAGYVDYVTSQEQYQTTAAGAQYTRQWYVSAPTNGVKTITVSVKALFTAQATQSLAPQTFLMAAKNSF